MKPILLGAALLLAVAPQGVTPVGAASLDANPVAPSQAQTAATSSFAQPMPAEKRFAHLLNRLAFGPRPGDVEALQKTGVKPWIESQLAPQNIDDSALERQLASLSWLRQSNERLVIAYQSDNLRFLKRGRKTGLNPATPDAPAALTPRQRAQWERIEAAQLPPRASLLALGQLATDKLARASLSRRQLQEVLADFWGNHFNVDVKKGVARTLKISDDRAAIRPHLFGSFRKLLGASAHSPAMLWYLDNARSSREVVAKNGARRGGLNENYARELMELHTLGVDGGYTQADVTEVARCFTGWSIDADSGAFLFRARAHDNGDKVVLGHRIAAGGGANDGERVLDILAAHPATARFVALKLCQRFVADAPPAALVERVALVFLRSQGDLTATYRAIFEAPEFWSQGALASKIKSPFEFTTSAVRALGGTLDVDADAPRLALIGAASLDRGANANRAAKRPLALKIAAMGQPLFGCLPPTGWSENSAGWVSASALVARLNFALALTAGRVSDVALAQDTFRPATVEAAAAQLGVDIAPATRDTIAAETQKTPGDGARLRALLLGSPEFQRH